MTYLVKMSYNIHVQAESPEAAIKQLEEDLEEEPLYGPFNYEIIEISNHEDTHDPCYFALLEDPDEFGEPVFLIVTQEFWNKNHYIDDYIPSQVQLPESLVEVQEAVFGMEATTPDLVRKQLQELGHSENTELLGTQ